MLISASGVAGLLRAGQTVTVIGMISPDLINENPTTVLPATIPESSLSLLSPPLRRSWPPPRLPRHLLRLRRLPLLWRAWYTGLKVLMVPQPFRYEEVPAGAPQDQLYSSARTTMSAQEGSVIVLDVPTTKIEVVPGLCVDPASLLAALDQFGSIHLALEPSAG